MRDCWLDWGRSGAIRKTGKILTCNGLFYPRGNVARLYLKICERGTGLISTKDSTIWMQWTVGLYGKSEEPRYLKRILWWRKRERRSMIEGLKKGMKPTGRKKAYMECS